MNISRILAVLALVAGASVAYGCGSSSFTTCNDTRSCDSNGGADGGLAGSGSTGTGGAGTGTGGASTGGAGTGGAGGASGGGTAGTAGLGGTGGSGPTLDDNGTICSDSSICKSGKCVDGVCCNTACNGTCETCDASGKEGTCTPYANGTDPESECLGKANAGTLCAGSCDGSSACTFPAGKISCGSAMCAAGEQTTYGCGGDGSCAPVQTSCGRYACGASTCRTSCTKNSQCSSSAWCQSDQCVPRIADGKACGASNQCQHGHCIGAVCCHTACNAPDSCGTGTCLCNGVTCGSGHHCILWYLDQDGDGYAASSSYDKAGCDNQPPPPKTKGHKYYATAKDCYDKNANAHPGQTKWFTQNRGDGSFDYNCVNGPELRYNGTSSTTCKDCGWYDNLLMPPACRSCGNSNITGPHYSMALQCNGSCGGDQSAFQGLLPPGCGDTGTLLTCSSTSCSTQPTTQPRTQACH